MRRLRDHLDLDPTTPEDPRGSVETPRQNPSGLDALAYRLATHPEFLARMRARLPSMTLPDGPWAGRRPLTPLGERNVDDPAVALLDTWALAGDVLTFYQERFANEHYLRTARDRRSILELARLVGQELGPGAAASAFLAFTVDDVPDSPTEVLVPAGTQVQSLPKQGQLPQTFETQTAVNARLDLNSLRPRRVQVSDLSRRRLVLGGIETGLTTGSRLLALVEDAAGKVVVARPLDVQTVTVEIEDDFTRVELVHPLGLEPGRGELEGTGLEDAESLFRSTRIFALRERVAAFGNSAPLYGSLPNAEFSREDPFDDLEANWDTGRTIWTDSRGELHSDGTDPSRPAMFTDRAIDGLTAESWTVVSGPLRQPVVEEDPAVPSGAVAAGETSPSAAATTSAATTPTAPTPAAAGGGTASPPEPPPEGVPADAILASTFIPGVGDARVFILSRQSRVAFIPALAPENLLIPIVVAGSRSATIFVPEIGPLPVFFDDGVALPRSVPGGDPTASGDPTAVSSPTVEEASTGEEATGAGAVAGSAATARAGRNPAALGPRFTEIYRLTAVSEDSVADYALSGTANGLALADRQGDPLPADVAERPAFDLRSTRIWVLSEELELIEEPITEPYPKRPEDAGGRALVLDRRVEGLEVGQPLAIRGTRASGPEQGEETVTVVLLQQVDDLGDFSRLCFLDPAVDGAVDRDTMTVQGNVVLATHGTSVEEILGSGHAGLANQSFPLRQGPLTWVSAPVPGGVASTLELRVDGVLWREVPTLAVEDGESQSYEVRLDAEGQPSVHFGDGTNGARLPSGLENVTARYRSGLGPVGEVEAESLTLLNNRPLGIQGVTNPLSASGAAPPDDVERARHTAPVLTRTFGRLVAPRDYEDFARTFAGIARARAARLGGLHLTVAGLGGKEVLRGSTLFDHLVKAFEERRLPGPPVVLASWERVDFEVVGRLVITTGFVADQVLAAAREVLAAAFAFEHRDFGQPVFASEVIDLLQDVVGVEAVTLDVLTPHGGARRRHNRLDPKPTRLEGGEIRPAQILVIDPEAILLGERTP